MIHVYDLVVEVEISAGKYYRRCSTWLTQTPITENLVGKKECGFTYDVVLVASYNTDNPTVVWDTLCHMDFNVDIEIDSQQFDTAYYFLHYSEQEASKI